MRVIHNLDLTNFNSYKLHSIAKTAFFPETQEEILEIVNKEPAIIIGGGCNVILSKEEYSLPILFIRNNFSGIERIAENHLVVKAGTDLKELSEFALKNELSGLEYYYDIPGCVGGATIMNAGCQGVSFCDFLKSITYFDFKDSQVHTISKEEALFEYRSNIFNKKQVIILEVEIVLSKGRKSNISALMLQNKESRWEKQPRNYPSAGSVFKRPVGKFVGPMISECGLKGYRIGDAMVSEKHAGFIVNMGDAKGHDIVKLIELIQEKVKEKFNISLLLEQRII